MSGYKVFFEYVHKMLVVNDPAERGVKLIQDFVNTTQDEDIVVSHCMAVFCDIIYKFYWRHCLCGKLALTPCLTVVS
jgi:hypothetical protein